MPYPLPRLFSPAIVAGLFALTGCTLSSGDGSSSTTDSSTSSASDNTASSGNGQNGSTSTSGSSTAQDNTASGGNTVVGSTGSGSTISFNGVAATGAPLLAAKIRAYDLAGKPVNLQDAGGGAISADSISTADGSFRLTLASGISPAYPLILQADGTDATGRPVALHSLVASSSVTHVSITPFSDAVVAQLLGASPKAVLQNASANASVLALLANATAVASAASQITTITKANLAGAKAASTLDVLQTPFTANKTGADLALESLSIGIDTDSSGKEILSIGNKFVSGGEVSVVLATARTELAKTSGGDVSKAISSTSKTTTYPTLSNLDSLDRLGAAINTLIAQRVSVAGYTGAPELAAYRGYNGRTLALLAARLYYWASRGYQLSNFQIAGCADNPVPTKGCSNFEVGAIVTDSKGNQVDVFRDVAAYSTAAAQWQLLGNGRLAPLAVYPVAYLTLGSSGTAITPTAGAPNPTLGIEVAVDVLDETIPDASTGAAPGQIVSSAVVTVPSGFAIPMGYCSQSTLCVDRVDNTGARIIEGNLQDKLLLQTSKGWVGNSKDGAARAAYTFSVTPNPVAAASSYTQYLPASVNLTPASSLFPQLDSGTLPASLNSSRSLSWKSWARANPGMQVFMVRTVAQGGSLGSPVSNEIRIPDPLATPSINIGSSSITLPALSASGAATVELWLGARDTLGRRYYSKYQL